MFRRAEKARKRRRKKGRVRARERQTEKKGLDAIASFGDQKLVLDVIVLFSTHPVAFVAAVPSCAASARAGGHRGERARGREKRNRKESEREGDNVFSLSLALFLSFSFFSEKSEKKKSVGKKKINTTKKVKN